jgi:hypothetical protein
MTFCDCWEGQFNTQEDIWLRCALRSRLILEGYNSMDLPKSHTCQSKLVLKISEIIDLSKRPSIQSTSVFLVVWWEASNPLKLYSIPLEKIAFILVATAGLCLCNSLWHSARQPYCSCKRLQHTDFQIYNCVLVISRCSFTKTVVQETLWEAADF